MAGPAQRRRGTLAGGRGGHARRRHPGAPAGGAVDAGAGGQPPGAAPVRPPRAARRRGRLPPRLQADRGHLARLRAGAHGLPAGLARPPGNRSGGAPRWLRVLLSAGRPDHHRVPGGDGVGDVPGAQAQRPRAGGEVDSAPGQRRPRRVPDRGDVPDREGGRLRRRRQRDPRGPRRGRQLAALRREVVRHQPHLRPGPDHGPPRGRRRRHRRPGPVPDAARPPRRRPRRPHQRRPPAQRLHLPSPQAQVRQQGPGLVGDGPARRLRLARRRPRPGHEADARHGQLHPRRHRHDVGGVDAAVGLGVARAHPPAGHLRRPSSTTTR